MVKQFNNGQIVPPPNKTFEEVQKEKEQSIENNKYVNRLFRGDKGTIQKTLIFGVPLGVLAYSAYKIPKLPDHQPKEVLKAGALAVGGSFLAISIAAGSAMGGGGGKKTNILNYGLIGTSVAGFTYLASRSIFISQNPKMSFKYGLGFGLATIALLYYLDNRPQSSGGGKQVPIKGNETQLPIQQLIEFPKQIDVNKIVWDIATTFNQGIFTSKGKYLDGEYDVTKTDSYLNGMTYTTYQLFKNSNYELYDAIGIIIPKSQL